MSVLIALLCLKRRRDGKKKPILFMAILFSLKYNLAKASHLRSRSKQKIKSEFL
jgi:hypothetical protein